MREWLIAAFGVALLVVLIAPIGPVKLIYVYSDSMEPTIGTDDGVILITGEIEEGDIITYRSPDRGAYVTHRVVDQTGEGFITKGDANPTTDQASGAQPVDRSQIIGKALTFRGSPVTVPAVGLLASTVQERPLLSVAVATLAGTIALALSQWQTSLARAATDTPLTAGEIVNTAFVVALVTLLALSYVGASTQTLTFTATEGGGEDADTIAVEEATVKTLPFNVSASGSGHYAVGTRGMAVQNQSLNASTLAVTVRIPPPETAGEVTATVRVYHYPSVLPDPVATRLDRLHPLVGVTGSLLAALTPLYLLAGVLLDRKRPVHPPRSKRLKHIHDRLI